MDADENDDAASVSNDSDSQHSDAGDESDDTVSSLDHPDDVTTEIREGGHGETKDR
jgi:hypothetical protein